MTQLLWVVPPILMIVILGAVKRLLRKFELVDFALELHITGMTFLAPLPIERAELAEPLIFVVFLICSLFCIPITCYVVVSFELSNNRKFFQKVGLLVGLFAFSLGLLTAIILA